MVMLKKMGFSMEMMRTRKGFCEKAIVIVWHLVSGSSQPSRGIDIGTHENMMVIIMTVMIIKIIFQRQRIWNQHWHSWKYDDDDRDHDHDASDDDLSSDDDAKELKSCKSGQKESRRWNGRPLFEKRPHRLLKVAIIILQCFPWWWERCLLSVIGNDLWQSDVKKKHKKVCF